MASRYKEQLIAWLKTKDISAGKVMSLGCQGDDKAYFKTFEADDFRTLDFNPAFSPTVVHDMNRPLFPEGYELNDDYESFDLVLALELFEYVWNPVQALENISGLLKKGGRFIASFPFVYPSHNPAGTDYMRYTPDGVEVLLKHAGLRVVEHSYRHGGPGLLAFYQGERMKARDGFDHSIVGSLIIAEKP